jgi:hypothetical protein
MTLQMMARLALVIALTATAQAGGCRVTTPAVPTPGGGRALGTPRATEVGTPDAVATRLPPAEEATGTATAAVEATAAPTATLEAALPRPPGLPLAASTWRTLVRAPGLPDMDATAGAQGAEHLERPPRP